MAAKKKKTRGADPNLLEQINHPNAAGVDIAAEEMVAAVPRDRAVDYVRTFSSFTRDLHALRDWFLECRIETVAIESTGNYWVPLYQILEEAGLEVFLVNARDVKGIGGRKTDVADAQWLQQLHTAGLLKKSFRPVKEVAALRYLMRHRGNLIRCSATLIQQMQKTLTECNLQLHHVFSDLDGKSAQRIIEAILAGDRDPQKLAQLRDARCRTPLAKVLKALEGDYREEYLFVLAQCLEQWKQIQKTLIELDAKIEASVAAIAIEPTAPPSAGPTEPGAPLAGPIEPSALSVEPPLKRRLHKNSPRFDIFAQAYRFYGVDLAQVPGVASTTLSVLMSELGTGEQIKAAFKSAKDFCSWLALCPENKISGGKVLRAKTRRSANRVAAALRQCSQSLSHSKSLLGDFVRRFKGRLGKAEGITAGAHKLARIIYSMLTTKQDYDEAKAFTLTPAKKARRVQQLLVQAARFGYDLVPASPAP